MSFVAERPKNPHPLAQGIDFSADKGSILGTNARVMRNGVSLRILTFLRYS